VVDNVSILEPEHMNLAGLLFAGFLRKQLSHPKLARKASRIRGVFGVQIGRMGLTLTFAREGIQVSKGIAPKTRARIAGSMDEMIALVTVSRSFIGACIAVLEGRLSVRGNPFALLRLLPIMLRKVDNPTVAIAPPRTNPPAALLPQQGANA